MFARSPFRGRSHDRRPLSRAPRSAALRIVDAPIVGNCPPCIVARNGRTSSPRPPTGRHTKAPTSRNRFDPSRHKRGQLHGVFVPADPVYSGGGVMRDALPPPSTRCLARSARRKAAPPRGRPRQRASPPVEALTSDGVRQAAAPVAQFAELQRHDRPFAHERRPQPGAKPQEQHPAAMVGAHRLHDRIVDDPHRLAECLGEIKAHPA